HLGDAQAIAPLEHALGDPDEGVRARVRDALDLLRGRARPPPPPEPMPTKARFSAREPPLRAPRVVVNAMGNRSPSAARLTARLRQLVVERLADEPSVAVGTSGESEFIVDGSITRLSRETHGPWIEVTCEVKLTVSSGSGSLLSVVSG